MPVRLGPSRGLLIYHPDAIEEVLVAQNRDFIKSRGIRPLRGLIGGDTMGDALSTMLETTEAERLATGFGFTEGPLWHPDGFYYFVDIRGSAPELRAKRKLFEFLELVMEPVSAGSLTVQVYVDGFPAHDLQ